MEPIADPSTTDTPVPTTVLDVTVPVYNEAHVLESSIATLHAYLSANFPFSWRITVVDNASTDATLDVATRCTERFADVHVLHLDRKGRGLALREAWSRSDAQVCAYMDVDLSTGLDALLPLVAPLITGHSDMAIGSRLAPGASVARGPRREIISRTYNVILRTVFAVRFRDAQCGFKAVRTDIARHLLPAVEDNGWFFDTELLLLAEHNGLRVHEVPVDWVDDPDSRVNVRRTATDDLKGVWRMAKSFVRGGGTARPRTASASAAHRGLRSTARRLRRRRPRQHHRVAAAVPVPAAAPAPGLVEHHRASPPPRSPTPGPTGASRSGTAAASTAAATTWPPA